MHHHNIFCPWKNSKRKRIWSLAHDCSYSGKRGNIISGWREVKGHQIYELGFLQAIVNFISKTSPWHLYWSEKDYFLPCNEDWLPESGRLWWKTSWQLEIAVYSLQSLHPATWKEAKCLSSALGRLKKFINNCWIEGKNLVYKISSAFYGKRSQKYFPCEQWQRNLNLFFPHGERSDISAFLLFGEAGKREQWEWSLEASLGRGMLSKETMDYCRISFKEIEFCGHLHRDSIAVSTPECSLGVTANQQGIPFPALQAILPP